MKLELLIPTLIAIYGAILSTVLAIHELRKNRPMLKVTASFGYFHKNSGEPSEPVILFQAINNGPGNISLASYGFLNIDKSKYQFLISYPPGALPVDLEERKMCTVGYSCRNYREKLDYEKIKAIYFQDQTGKIWIGKISKKDKKLWLSSKNNGWQIN